MWGEGHYDNSYWPQTEASFGPQRGWQGHVRQHQADISMPPAYAQGATRRPAPLAFPPSAWELGPRPVRGALMPRGPFGAGGAVPPRPPVDDVNLYQDFNDPLAPVPIHVTCRTSAVLCEIHWSTPALHSSQQPYHFKVDAQANHVETVELGQFKRSMRIKTTPGEWYTVEITAISKSRPVARGKIQFKAVFSREELEQLYRKAVGFIGTDMHQFEVLYRCKPRPYYDDIKFNRCSVMEKYIKDNNGQAASPINGEIYGLFFSARLTPSMTLPDRSPFGDIRMMIPATTLYDPDRVNIYFSDFYCNYTTHYVTIVCAERGGETDVFCQRVGLIPLNADDNPFIKCLKYPGYTQFFVAKKVWVEFYFTEHVQLVWGTFSQILATGAGTSKPGGLPHNKFCRICNLYPLTSASDSTEREAAEKDRANAAKRHAEETGENGPDDDAKRRRGDFEYNSTFHLSMEAERERVIDAGGSGEGVAAASLPGDVDIVDSLCYLVDSVVQEVGDTISLPAHGFVGRPYIVRDLFAIVPTPEETATSSSPKPEDMVKLLPKIEVQVKPGKENLETESGRAAFQKLKAINDDLDRRCRELQNTLTALQSGVSLLEKKVKPLRSNA